MLRNHKLSEADVLSSYQGWALSLLARVLIIELLGGLTDGMSMMRYLAPVTVTLEGLLSLLCFGRRTVDLHAPAWRGARGDCLQAVAAVYDRGERTRHVGPAWEAAVQRCGES